MRTRLQPGPMTRGRSRAPRSLPVAAAGLLALTAACGESSTAPPGLDLSCDVPLELVAERPFDGDETPALTNPNLAIFGQPGAFYLRPDDRVIGLVVHGQAIAVPHNILWWHEIVNFDIPGSRIAVSYSPLTGSSLAFDLDRAGVDKFLVSDFMFNSNTMLEDAETGSLWPQMSRTAACGERTGFSLAIVPTWEMSWLAWRRVFPGTLVVSSLTGFDFFYSIYPYGDYETIANVETLFPVEGVDVRRAPKERVLGIPVGRGGVAFPYLTLREAAGPLEFGSDAAAVVNREVDGRPIVVFWSTIGQTAVAFRAEVDGQPLTFHVTDNQIHDLETGSFWNLAGQVLDGPLEGEQLELVPDAYTAFWFAWALFQPETEIWSP